MSKLPDNEALEPLFRVQVQKHPGLTQHVPCYEELPFGHTETDCKLSLTIAPRYLEAKRRIKARDELSRGGGRVLPTFGSDTPRTKAACDPWIDQGKCARPTIARSPITATRTEFPRRAAAKGTNAATAAHQPGEVKRWQIVKRWASRAYLKRKCSKGTDCAYGHSSHCRFFRKGNCTAGDRRVSGCARRRHACPGRRIRGGEDRRRRRRGRSPTPKGALSGGESSRRCAYMVPRLVRPWHGVLPLTEITR